MKKGDKVKFQDTVRTVDSFYGESGIVYDTYDKARAKNKGLICVKFTHGGSSSYDSVSKL